MGNEVGMIEMSGACLDLFLDIVDFTLGADSINVGTAGDKFFMYAFEVGFPTGWYWNASYFPDASGFPYDETYAGLARSIGDFGNAEVLSPFSLMLQASATTDWSYQAYYTQLDNPPINRGFGISFYLYDVPSPRVSLYVDRAYQGFANAYQAHWDPTPEQKWGEGDFVGISFDPVANEGWVYVNDTRYDLSWSSIPGNTLSPGPENNAEQIAFAGEMGLYPPQRFSAAVGMLSGNNYSC